MKNTPPDFHFLHSLIEKTKEKEGKTSVKYHFYLFYNKKNADCYTEQSANYTLWF